MYQDTDNTKWIEYLERIADEEDEDGTLPNYNSLLVNLATIQQQPTPIIVQSGEQYLQMLNLMS